MKHRAWRLAVLMAACAAALQLAGCAGRKMDSAAYERAVERQNQDEFQKRLAY